MLDRLLRRVVLGAVSASVLGCGTYVERPPAPVNEGIYSFAGGCFVMDATAAGSNDTRWLKANVAGDAYAFSATRIDEGTRFTVRASDLGTYLFYDAEAHYLVAEEGVLRRASELLSDVLLIDDAYQSPAEWELQVSPSESNRFALRHRATGQYLTTTGLAENVNAAAVITLYPSTGCAPFPELTIDAEGSVEPRAWPDGDVFGFVETHTHLFTNFGFGGGGMFHGSPFHRLGVDKCQPNLHRNYG